MPKLMATSDNQIIDIPGAGNFQFSAIRIEDLGATEYTLVTIVCDISGSVHSFADDLLACIQAIVMACKKSPRAENLLLRLLLFNDDLHEVHGFINLADIKPNEYDPLDPDSMTALFDASYDAIAATLEYSKRLVDQDFDCNGIVFIITDGMDNRSSMTPTSIKEKVANAMIKEEIESLNTILISLYASNYHDAKVKMGLEKFHVEAELTHYEDIGEATPGKLAKLANFASESISSQSQALGTGAPSQTLNF